MRTALPETISKPHSLYYQWWDVHSYVGEGRIGGSVEFGGNCEKCCSVESVWGGGTKLVMNVYLQVLGLSQCLVWPHCVDVPSS